MRRTSAMLAVASGAAAVRGTSDVARGAQRLARPERQGTPGTATSVLALPFTGDDDTTSTVMSGWSPCSY